MLVTVPLNEVLWGVPDENRGLEMGLYPQVKE